jgi:hypothetical protein
MFKGRIAKEQNHPGCAGSGLGSPCSTTGQTFSTLCVYENHPCHPYHPWSKPCLILVAVHFAAREKGEIFRKERS